MNGHLLTYVREAYDAYVAAALWSSTWVDADGDDVAMDSAYSADDIAPESRLAMLRDVLDFVTDNLETIGDTDDYRSGRSSESAQQVGHDLWLTRNRHGTGFWDRRLSDDIGGRLTDAAHAMGSSDLYVGDDGKVHVS